MATSKLNGNGELAAFKSIAEHGFYMPEVVRLILGHLKNPEKIRKIDKRLEVYSILVTIERNRRNLKSAKALAEAGLKLARRCKANGLNESLVYLLDQLGGIRAMQGDFVEAQSFFEEEVAHLLEHRGRKGWARAQFHLVGAYRGLAAVLGAMGDAEGAKRATAESKKLAAASQNPEGEALAALQIYEREAEQGSALPDERMLEALPPEHLIAQVMAQNLRAKAYLRQKQTAEGERLLKLAYRNAKRLGFGGEVETAKATAARFSVKLV